MKVSIGITTLKRRITCTRECAGDIKVMARLLADEIVKQVDARELGFDAPTWLSASLIVRNGQTTEAVEQAGKAASQQGGLELQ